MTSIPTPANPLDDAIVHAVAMHPAVAHAPRSLRPSRSAAVTAAAEAMADAREADPDDAALAMLIAPQIVDDAALLLSLHHERTAPVVLDGDAKARHDRLAEHLSGIPTVVAAGLDDAHTLARIEDALARTLLVRAHDLVGVGIRQEDLVRGVLSTAMRTAIIRGVRISDEDDAGIVQLVEDSLDDVVRKE